MQVRESAQSQLLERIWHRSWGKGGANEAPSHPPLAQSSFASGCRGYRSSVRFADHRSGGI